MRNKRGNRPLGILEKSASGLIQQVRVKRSSRPGFKVSESAVTAVPPCRPMASEAVLSNARSLGRPPVGSRPAGASPLMRGSVSVMEPSKTRNTCRLVQLAGTAKVWRYWPYSLVVSLPYSYEPKPFVSQQEGTGMLVQKPELRPAETRKSQGAV